MFGKVKEWLYQKAWLLNSLMWSVFILFGFVFIWSNK